MTNINYIMDMTKSFLDGEIDYISFYLDFPYEVEKRYRKMVREDRDQGAHGPGRLQLSFQAVCFHNSKRSISDFSRSRLPPFLR